MTDRTCAELFDHTHATIIGDADRPILGVAYRSDQVSPGDAFCCIVGLKADGHAFAQRRVRVPDDRFQRKARRARLRGGGCIERRAARGGKL